MRRESASALKQKLLIEARHRIVSDLRGSGRVWGTESKATYGKQDSYYLKLVALCEILGGGKGLRRTLLGSSQIHPTWPFFHLLACTSRFSGCQSLLCKTLIKASISSAYSSSIPSRLTFELRHLSSFLKSAAIAAADARNAAEQQERKLRL